MVRRAKVGNFPGNPVTSTPLGVTGWLHTFEARPVEQGLVRDERDEKRRFVECGASVRMKRLV